jgi:addiction module RelE/StbE family toxin
VNIYWTSSFKKGYKKAVNKYPQFREDILQAIQELKENPHSTHLKTHKLKGELEGSYACSVGYNLRIIFNLVKNSVTQKSEILLIDVGTHDEVY